MIYKILILLGGFGLAAWSVKGSNIDSLEQALKRLKPKTEAATLYQLHKNLGKSYLENNQPQNALQHYEAAFHLVQKVNPQDKAEVLFYLGNCQFRLQQYAISIQYLQEGIQITQEKKLQFKIYNYLSKCHLALGQPQQAYEFQFKALQKAEESQDSVGIATTTYDIGSIYFYQNNYKLALKNYKKALALALAIQHEKLIYTTYGGIGSAYHRLGNTQKSVFYNLQSLKLAEKMNYDVGIAYASFNIGSDFFYAQQYDSALVFLQKALALQRKTFDKWGESTCLRMLGETNNYLQNHTLALDYALQALALARQINAKPRIMEAYETLSRVYENADNYEAGNFYLRAYLTLKDSLVNEEMLGKIEEVQTDYEVAQRERQLLQQQQKLDLTYRYSLIGGLLLTLLLLWVIYNRFRYQIKSNRILEEKNAQIQQQNELLRTKNRKIQQQNLELENTNQDLRRFAFIASHDLKEPLRTIGSYASLLNRRYKNQLDEDAQTFLQFITSGVSRMYDLLNEVLDYSKIEHSPQNDETVDVKEVMENVVINLQDHIQKKQAVIEVGELPQVKGSNVYLTQVFQNLVTNGLKYNHSETPIISVDCAADSTSFVFSVKDNGIGLDMSYKDKIFEMFQRLHHRDEYGGTGVGLAICKKIVQQYGGDIWVDSKEGEGSTFYFSLPRPFMRFQEEVNPISVE